jgi:hypothetical protein
MIPDVGALELCGGSRNDPAVGKIEVVVADARGSGGVSASVPRSETSQASVLMQGDFRLSIKEIHRPLMRS